MFQGFTQGTTDFLWGIRFNNERGWFLAHKEEFQTLVDAPLRELASQVSQAINDKFPNLQLNCKVSRIYRDTRLHPPEPYKESLWICIRQDVEWWGENPCLYFEINPEGVDYGFFFWKPRTSSLEDFRRAITDRPDEFLSMLAQVEQSTGQPVQAVCYRRPKPCDNPALAPYFAWKEQISCVRHEDFGPDTFDSALENRVAEFFRQLLPLYDYFTRFKA